mmetsp:Transcript_46893/g.74054  ORF Transcript_46893/g.74054 Transcript_46893/m.74054 type:complete len:127 (-) Transcript_46893:364-744(-)
MASVCCEGGGGFGIAPGGFGEGCVDCGGVGAIVPGLGGDSDDFGGSGGVIATSFGCDDGGAGGVVPGVFVLGSSNGFVEAAKSPCDFGGPACDVPRGSGFELSVGGGSGEVAAIGPGGFGGTDCDC